MPTLQFKGKNIIWNHHLAVPFHTLDEVPELHCQPEKANGNMIIEGDNLIALKALLPEFSNRIDVVCIDPPYNTGNDNGQGKGWIYNDRVNSPLIKEWFAKEVGLDDLTRHDKWCCMISPRLKLLRELMKDEGSIFISLDDNEMYTLRSLMNEIFGEENFIALLPTIMNLKGNQDQFAFAGTHEYTLVYAKNKIKSRFYEFELDDEDADDWEYDNIGPFKKGRGLLADGKGKFREERQYMYFPLLVKDGKVFLIQESEYKKIYDVTSNSFNDKYVDDLVKKYTKEGYKVVLPIDSNNNKLRWTWGFDKKFMSHLDEIIVTETKNGLSLNKKQRPTLGELPSKKPKTIFYKPQYSSGNGTNQLKELLPDKEFNNPKPIDLIKDFIIISTDKNAIILDSFSGSGTTMHAVLELNKEDGGNRKCIMVQMPENSEAEPDKNICKDITRERVKRAIEKYGFDAGFQYYRLGLPLDAETMLAGQLPTYKQFAKYVYYLCTGENLEAEDKINEAEYYVGEYGKQAIYLVYKQDYDTLTRLALNLTLAKKIKEQQPGKKRIVYAPSCFLDEEYLTDNQIEYVGIPYNLFQRNQ